MRNFQLIIISIFFSGSLIFSQEIIPSIKSKYIIEIKKLAEEPKIKAAFKKIDKLEKTEIELNINTLFEELFQWPLAVGLFLLCLEFALAKTIFLRIP